MTVLGGSTQVLGADGKPIPGKDALQLSGPRVEVLVLPLAQTQAGALLKVHALIDTGASHTAVDEQVLKQLGVQPIDKIKMGGAHGEQDRLVYACAIEVPGHPRVDLPRCVSVDLKSQKLSVLIGRDFLRDKLLVYDGQKGIWTLAW